ncbi:MAG: glycosyltransferase family 2 protein [Flavobacteriales bacterium]
MGPLVSIIMPSHNAEPFIGEAIASVLAQDYLNWELLIVNDASTDGTARVVAEFTDPRIRVFHLRVNVGVSRARNVALDNVRGTILCSFDSDDVLPAGSLSARAAVLEREPDVDIVDGQVIVLDHDMKEVLRIFKPDFDGEPLNELITLSGKCFFGPTWMIRWGPGEPLRFCTELSHAEDLLFYISYSKGKRYKAVPHPVLHYRVTGSSAMSRSDGLERSYRYLDRWLRARPDLANASQVREFEKRWRGIMFRTWLKAGKPLAALRARFR